MFGSQVEEGKEGMKPFRQKPFRKFGLLRGGREPVLDLCVPCQDRGPRETSLVCLKVDREIGLIGDHEVQHQFK